MLHIRPAFRFDAFHCTLLENMNRDFLFISLLLATDLIIVGDLFVEWNPVQFSIPEQYSCA
jgi:hypothetical protein